MTQEDKELLLRYLSAMLPYKVEVYYSETVPISTLKTINSEKGTCIVYDHSQWYRHSKFHIEEVKPYLRPMSSMTEEEKEELLNRLPKYWGLEIDKLGDLYFDICDAGYPSIELLTDIIDWLNAHHFDYRGLIEKGLALEAPDGMYDIKEKATITIDI